jgi:hypothetical protein
MSRFSFASLFLASGEEGGAGYRSRPNKSPCPSEDGIEASDRIAQSGVCSTLDTKQVA